VDAGRVFPRHEEDHLEVEPVLVREQSHDFIEFHQPYYTLLFSNVNVLRADTLKNGSDLDFFLLDRITGPLGPKGKAIGKELSFLFFIYILFL